MIKSIVLITNEINPYRKSFYDKLFDYCKLLNIKFTVLLMTRVEHGYNWDYEKVKSNYAILMKGIHFSFPINNYLNLEVVKYLKLLKPDIVLMAGSYFYYTNWLAIAYRHKLKYPIYFWSETHLNEKRIYASYKLKIREFIRKILYSKFAGFLYAGKLSKELSLNYANRNAKFHFLPNLIEENAYYRGFLELRPQRNELRKKWHVKNDDIIVITPARLIWVKGIHTFLELLEQVNTTRHVVMLIPGAGNYKREIEKKIAETKLDVRLLGHQQQEQTIELYAISDFFILPSLSDANPLTCIEALWSGLPLMVSTHVGNYPEVIKEGLNGYVFDYANPQEAVSKIECFLQSSKEWQEKATQVSLEIANNLYNSKNVVKRLIDDLVKENL